MSDLFAPTDTHDPRLALGASGPLADFNRAGLLSAGDVHVARALGEIARESDPSVLLAVALTCRAVRTGSVCLDLARARDELVVLEDVDPTADAGAAGGLADLSWPDPEAWISALAASRLVADQVVRLHGSLLYLDRYHEQETQVIDDLLTRDSTSPERDPSLLEQTLARVFPVQEDGTDTWAEQRAACRTAASRWTTVLTGGPGTGKTTAVAGLLVALDEQATAQPGAGLGPGLRIALAAPTGKAAARLQEAVHDSASRFADADRARLDRLSTSTLHRLLRMDPSQRTRFRHHRHHRLPYDVVVVDEASMMSLTMTARLLEAMRPDARLLLVGDPDQLSPVGAGAVLADLVTGYAGSSDTPVAALRTTHRFSGGIATLAEALRAGDADAVVDALRHGHLLDPDDPGVGRDVEWVTEDDPTATIREVVLPHAIRVVELAAVGDARAALDAAAGHRLLCAHRDGPHGVQTWNRRVEQWLAASGVVVGEPFHVGRPVLVTANDYALGVHNGDAGVVVESPEGRRVVLDVPGGLRDLAPSRMGAVETMHAMTIHKAQGSQARDVTVLLPGDDSRLLSRELLYTAVTRATRKVRVVGSETVVRAAVERTARRASGLAERLRDEHLDRVH